MKTAIIALTTGGYRLANSICEKLEDSFVDQRKIPVFEKIESLWKGDTEAIVCIMATGIVVRALAPLCNDKQKDPCVLVLDERGRFVISLLSGHVGGGNEMARVLAAKLEAQAVITTASDVVGNTALDLWARKNGLLVSDKKKLTKMSTKLVNKGSLQLYTDCTVDQLPDDLIRVSDVFDADIIVSDKLFGQCDALILRPQSLCVGIGCNRGTDVQAFEAAMDELLKANNFSRDAVSCYASIDLKNDESGMLSFAANEQRPIIFYTKEELNSVEGVSSSAADLKATGAKGVAEPAAVLAAQTNNSSAELIVRKHKWKDVTAAIAVKTICLQD